MYLARCTINNTLHFVIRESFPVGDHYSSRDLLDLGARPQQYIRYADSRVFFVDERVLAGLQECGVEADPVELEKLFYPFVDPEVRHRLDSFRGRGERGWKPTLPGERRRLVELTHEFDRRRIHFLRFGQTDQRRLDRAAVLYRVLLDKSRDELEQYFISEEQVLKPAEYKRYLYAIFDLQRFFTESYAYSMPEALPEEVMDSGFVKQVCRLDEDEGFWVGMRKDDRLPEYLVRYVIMYFDYVFPTAGAWSEYIRDFMDARRRFNPPRSGRRVSMSEAATVFGISRRALAELGSAELKRLFREKAREMHPDRGGDHERFIELANAYQEILRTKGGRRQ